MERYSFVWSIFRSMVVLLVSMLFVVLSRPVLSLNPDYVTDFFTNFTSVEMYEYMVKLVLTLWSFAFIVSIFFFVSSIGFILVWVIYRLSLSRIYRKPRRVYPVEKQKFFSVY